MLLAITCALLTASIVALTAGEETGGLVGVRCLAQNHRDLLDAELALNEGRALLVAPDLSKMEAVQIGVAEKTFQSFRLTVKGKGGHSSVPPTDLDPVVTLARALQRVGELRFPAKVIPEAREGIALAAKSEKPPLADALKRACAGRAAHGADERRPIRWIGDGVRFLREVTLQLAR